jgi:hypothetical protein
MSCFFIFDNVGLRVTSKLIRDVPILGLFLKAEKKALCGDHVRLSVFLSVTCYC